VQIGNNNMFNWPRKGTKQHQNATKAGDGMTAQQEELVFSLYALVKTPLFIGADVTTLDGHSLQTYLNLISNFATSESNLSHSQKMNPIR
jgi:hypothetical protein